MQIQPIINMETTETTNVTTSTLQTDNTPIGIPEFVKKLFRMLEQDSRTDILTWGMEGTSFVVRDPSEFARLILPKHFKHCNFASFVRQLNKYDFHKVRNSEDGQRPYGDQSWEFQHSHFQYNRRDLLDGIKRKTTTKSSVARTSSGATINNNTSSISHEQKTTPVLSVTASSDFNNTTALASTSPCTSLSANKVTSDELKSVVFQLQSQIEQLQQQQTSFTNHLQGLDHDYNGIIEIVANVKKYIVSQDQFMNQLATRIMATHQQQVKQDQQNYISSSNGVDVHQVLESYGQVAQQSDQQIKQISKHIKSAQQIIYSEAPLLSSSYDVPQQQQNDSHTKTDTTNSNNNNNSNYSFLPQTQQTFIPISSSISSESSSSTSSNIATATSLLSSSTQNTTSIICSQPYVNKTITTASEPIAKVLLKNNSTSGMATGAASATNAVVNDYNDPAINRVVTATTGFMKTITPAKRPRATSVLIPGWSVPPRVLLVDDDSIFRRISTRLLQLAGCTIDVAVDGIEACSKIVSHDYDIVLMDIMMPNLDGISATRSIRQHDTWTPIISMTANTADSDVREYIMSGMTDVLPKPLDHSVLCKLLERYCAHLKLIQRQQQQQQNHNMITPSISCPESSSLTTIPSVSISSSSSSIAYSSQQLQQQQRQQQDEQVKRQRID